MKIVDVSEFYAERGGGVRTYTDQKLRAASRRGHELIVVAPGPRDREQVHLGGRVVWLKNPRFPLDTRYHVFTHKAALLRVLEREQPDVIEGSSLWSGGCLAALDAGPALKALVFHQDPVAVYAHTLLDRQLSAPRIDALCTPYWRFVRALASHYDVTVTASEWLARRLREHGIASAQAVPFGCDTTPFAGTRRDPALRARLLTLCKVPSDAALLVCLSRHHPEKRLHTLCRAVGKLRAQRPVGLVIYGDGPFRPLVSAWAARAGCVHLAGHTGDRTELAGALACADALLHGSAAETYGMAVAEALSVGLPVVAPDSGGAAELLVSDCSELYPAGDADVCALAIERLLARPQARLRQAASQHARAVVRDLDAHFVELFDRYASLLAARHAPPRHQHAESVPVSVAERG